MGWYFIFTCCLISFHVSLFLQFLHSVIGENHRGIMRSDYCLNFVCGGLAGITAASATYPLDLVRTRLAAQVNWWQTLDAFFKYASVFSIFLFGVWGLENK